MEIDELIDNFALLDDWEDKYRYIIDLGSKLPPLDDKYKTDDWKVRGCQSQVWLVPEVKERNGEKVLDFKGDSDAAIVKGIIAIILGIYSDKSAQMIKDIAVGDIFAKLGLEDHLSPSRRNGLASMNEKIKYYANVL